MADSRITFESVRCSILVDQTHTIWTPCLTLERMGIERYPHQPPHNRLAMRRVLEELHDAGDLILRDRLHSHSTFREVAYEVHPDVSEQGATR